MKRKIIILTFLVFSLITPSFVQVSKSVSTPGTIYSGEASFEYRNTTVYAPAVAKTENGYKGVISTITVTIQTNGSGRVFVDTLPLTQIDMQGSARLAVKVASSLVEKDKNCDVDPSTYDYFFVVRTSAPIIGGPSAGGIMTVATVSLLEKWDISSSTVMTGMINPDGSIGPVGGITHKIDAAASVGATRFLVPKGQLEYTEWVQERKGWITITKPVTRNVADYAMKHYGIKVIEVADIKEAVENFTGYRFFFNQSQGAISTEDYNSSMKPLASSLLEKAQDSYRLAGSEIENTSIPSGFFESPRDDVREGYKLAEKRLRESENWYNNNLYYTSTTKSFQSLIYSSYVIYACGFFNAENSSDYLKNLINKTEVKYENIYGRIKNEGIKGYISLQCIGGAQSRASTAYSYLVDVKKTYENNRFYSYSDVLNLLYDLALIKERCNSVLWWTNLSYNFTVTFSDPGKLNDKNIQDLALENINEAEQATTYSTILLQETGESSNYLNKAEDLLEEARKDKEKGYPASAFFKSLEALTRANLAIETLGVDNAALLVEKIKNANKSAAVSISESRGHGIEPIMAVSYYELAKAYFNESDYENALLYYRLSDMIAGALSFTNISTGGYSSRYIGILEDRTPFWPFLITNTDLPLVAGVAILAGVIAGLVLGWGLGRSYSEKEKEKILDKWMPRSVHGYKQKKNETMLSEKQVPKSIEDYFKAKK